MSRSNRYGSRLKEHGFQRVTFVFRNVDKPFQFPAVYHRPAECGFFAGIALEEDDLAAESGETAADAGRAELNFDVDSFDIQDLLLDETD